LAIVPSATDVHSQVEGGAVPATQATEARMCPAHCRDVPEYANPIAGTVAALLSSMYDILELKAGERNPDKILKATSQAEYCFSILPLHSLCRKTLQPLFVVATSYDSVKIDLIKCASAEIENFWADLIIHV
jgi:hypothetical protein